MRSLSLCAGLALVAAACGGSASSAETTPAPSTSATASTAPNPCATTTCQVVVKVSDEIAPEMGRKAANYKVYEGCPRSMGVNRASDLRASNPVSTSRTNVISLPSTFKGRLATVAVFFGAEPQRYTVVDLGANANAAVDFGYQWDGNALTSYSTQVNTNESTMNRLCR